MTLTPYAVGHLEMLNIDSRFEAVIARNPKYTSQYNRWRVNAVRDTARWLRYGFAEFTYRYLIYTGQLP